MTIQRLTCPHGHTWDQLLIEPLPGDLRTICPVCTAGQTTLDVRLPAEEKETPLTPGCVLTGFEILEELNRGGMGIIYKARQQALNRVVALKVINPDRLGKAEALKRFQREVQAAARLNHPNIVTVFHTDLEGPSPYLVMEYVSGIDLARLVKRVGPLPVTEACDYVLQAAEGLQHAHEQGLVHRDIKPANLMVTPSPLDPHSGSGRPPRIKILDLGLARMTSPAEDGTELTHAFEFLGTPDFISPEQAEDSRRADVRSDLYSLGATLFFLLTAEVPFPGGNVMQKLRRQLIEPTPSPAARRPDIPPGVDAVVRRLLALDPNDRFQTPTELLEALRTVLRAPTELPPGVPAPAPAEPFQTPGDLLAFMEKLAAQPVEADPLPSVRPAISVKTHAGGVQSLSLSADGQLLLSGGLDQSLRLWEAPLLREIRCITDHIGPVEMACLTPKGKWAASCALHQGPEDAVVQLWDLASGREARRLLGLTGKVHCVAIAPDGRRVAAGGEDKSIRIWAMDKPGSPSLCLTGHTGQVSSVSFLPGGGILLSGSHDATVQMWDVKTGNVKKTLASQVGPVVALAFGGPSKRFAVAGSRVRLRQADGSSTELAGRPGQVLCLAFSSDGQFLLTGGSDQTVRLWRASDGEELCCLRGHTGEVRAVVFSPDGKAGYSGSADGTICRWLLPC